MYVQDCSPIPWRAQPAERVCSGLQVWVLVERWDAVGLKSRLEATPQSPPSWTGVIERQCLYGKATGSKRTQPAAAGFVAAPLAGISIPGSPNRPRTLQQRQRHAEESGHHSDQPEAHRHLRLGPADQLEVVVDRAHLEQASAAGQL